MKLLIVKSEILMERLDFIMQAKMDKTMLIFGKSKPEFLNWLVCKEGHVDVVEMLVNKYWFECSKCEWNDSF